MNDRVIACETFQRLIPRFENQAPSAPAADGIDFQTWVQHFHACASCSNAVLAYRLAQRGVDAADHPCLHMAYHATETCDQHPDRAECDDLVIGYNDRFDEYTIIKGQVALTIAYCPWCGVKLPPSQRVRWFDAIATLGLDPWSDEIPERYRSGAWFKQVRRPGRS